MAKQVPFLLMADEVHQTVLKLQQRIGDRFPGSGLSGVCGHLANTAQQAAERSLWLRSPIYSFRVLAWAVTIGMAGVSTWSLLAFGHQFERLGMAEFIQVSEAAMNDIILICAAIFFLHTLEKRKKRSRALESIHELRSLAHIIDMHQLTKDPERITKVGFIETPASPKQTLSPFLLRRYLDYCSEMLSLTAKIAALYAQDLDDPTVLAAVSEVETLTTDLSRKIWQKITVIHSFGNPQN